MRYFCLCSIITLLILCDCAAFLPTSLFSSTFKRINYCRSKLKLNLNNGKQLPLLFNHLEIKKDFPIFIDNDGKERKDLIYLDNAASSQKPNCVIDKMSFFYRNHYSNVHRSDHILGNDCHYYIYIKYF